MTNLDIQDNIYRFSTNGGDIQTTKVALYGPSLCIFPAPIVYWFGLRPYIFPQVLPDFLDTWLLLLIIILGFISAFVLVKNLNKGIHARFEVIINRNKEIISAFDRLKNQHLWEEYFDPKNLYITTINVIISDEEFSFPTLVYAEDRLPRVEEGIPYPELSVLGYGEETDIHKVLMELMGEELSVDI